MPCFAVSLPLLRNSGSFSLGYLKVCPKTLMIYTNLLITPMLLLWHPLFLNC